MKCKDCKQELDFNAEYICACERRNAKVWDALKTNRTIYDEDF